MIKSFILIIGYFFLVSCNNSKKQVVEGLLQRREFWGERWYYYQTKEHKLDLERHSVMPPAMPSDTQLLYSAIADTAEWHLDEINDSLFKITADLQYAGADR